MNYYNEWDKYAAQWLRNLIAAKLIPPGDVDERDIRTVQAPELSKYEQCHFFAGIGGWPLALEMARWTGPCWTGSCPCQPFSVAGKRKGTADDRHLWPTFGRLIGECRPPVVFGEQVASKDGRGWLAGVRSDLEALGYRVGAADLCAAGAGAPHIRQRLYWLADAGASGRGALLRTGGAGGRDAEQSVGHGDTCRLGEPNRQGSQGRSDDAGEHASQRSAWTAGASGGVEHAARDGRRERWPESGRRRSEPRRGAVWMGDTAGDEQRGVAVSGDDRQGVQVGGSGWDRYELVQCSDGKARRIEPGTFPLAHGVPARVGKLRAYGNAIVPQVAAEFVMAYMETPNR